MRPPLPPNFQKPLMATREFRWFVIAVVVGLAAVAVIAFEIVPKMRAQEDLARRIRGKAFIPGAQGGAPREQRFDGVLDKAVDSSPVEQQDDPYLYLLRHLSRANPESIAQDARTVDFKYFAQVPGELRGRTVKLTGLYLKTEALRPDKSSGVEWIYRTYLSSLNGEEGYVVDLLEKPPGNLEPRRSQVETNALFLKLGTYEGNKSPVQAPFLVGKSIHLVPGAAEIASMNYGTMVLGVAIVSALVVGLLSVRIWSKSRERSVQAQQMSLVSGKA